MKKISFDDNIRKIEPMRDFLKLSGKEADFTSPVYHVILQDESEWVLKVTEEDAGIKELTEVIGEVAAYKICKSCQLTLVPTTKMVIYGERLASLQKFIDNTLNKNQYPTLLSSTGEDIQYLKLFCFIVGQWDTSLDNVLFTQEENPIAIDNANIANIQKVSAYGKPQFVRLFYTDEPDKGFIEEPIIISGTNSELVAELKIKFKDELPEFFKSSYKDTSFTYFIENHRVWGNFNYAKEQSNYFDCFMQIFSKTALEIFKSVDFISIFAKLIDKCANYMNENMLATFEISSSEELSLKLSNHFDLIAEGIRYRYLLAEDYLNSQPLLDNGLNVDVTGSAEPEQQAC